MSIWIGTASWSHPALIHCGRFYPRASMSAEERLRHYAEQFPLVEVDSSFHALTPPDMACRWAERTPEGFVMNAKAFRLFTGHPASPQALPADVRDELPNAVRDKGIVYYRDIPAELQDRLWLRFIEGLAPLRNAGRLGLVHFQFAPWVVRNRSGRAHVEHCMQRMQGHTVSLEFRNFSWFDGAHASDTLRFQRQLGAVHTVVDEPQGFENTVPAVWATSHESHALVRMHGRNDASWNHRGGGRGGRFNYEYDPAELEGLAWQIATLDRPGLRLHVVLNNNAQDFAQANARRLFETLQAIGAHVAAAGPGRSDARWAA